MAESHHNLSSTDSSDTDGTASGNSRRIFAVLRTLLLVSIVTAACYGRFTELSQHFTHNDDIGVAKTIMDGKIVSENSWFNVPRAWTYAPFQFLITHFLISPDDTYREQLFKGRLPSAVFGVLGVLLILFFYRRYEGPGSWTALSAAAVMACSWENIIHAKQMHNYALGVPAALLVMLLLLDLLNRREWPFPRMVMAGAALAALAGMHYEILFFVPAFFLTLFAFAWKTRKYTFGALAARIAASSASFALAVYPLWHFFLARHVGSRRDSWSWGPAQEFILTFADHTSLAAKISQAALFYCRNFFIVLHANMSFVPEEHWIYVALVYFVFSIAFILGIMSFIDTRRSVKKWFGLFFFLMAATWFSLVALQKLALSPTRHNLILLPLMAMVMAEGLSYACARLSGRQEGEPAAAVKVFHIFIVSSILAGFLMTYGQFLENRRDPFREKKILRTLQEYGVDAVVPSAAVQHLLTMRSLRGYYRYYMPGLLEFDVISAGNPAYETVAWISHRNKLTPENFKSVRQGANEFLFVRNSIYKTIGKSPVDYFRNNLEDYEILYAEEKESTTEIDYSRRTRNGANSFYFYVLRRKSGGGSVSNAEIKSSMGR